MATKTATKKKTVRKANPRTTKGSSDRNQVIDLVLENMRNGLSLRKASLASGTTAQAFLRWCEEDAELAEQYARARDAMLDKWADETLEIADQAFVEIEEQTTDTEGKPVIVKKKVPMDVNRAKLMVETRKWHLSKLAPRKYGDKLELTGDPDRPVAIQKIERVVVTGGKANAED